MAACDNPRLALGVLSNMLLFLQGVSQQVHEADCADLRQVHALTNNHFSSPTGTGFAGQALPGFGGQAEPSFEGQAASAEAEARRKQAQSSNAGGSTATRSSGPMPT